MGALGDTGRAVTGALIPGYGAYEMLDALGVFGKDDPIHPYGGSFGLIGPNALGRGPNMQYRYDMHKDTRSENAPWYENQNEYMRQYARNLTPDYVKNMLSQPGLISHMPGGPQSPGVLGPPSGISSLLAPYFNGQPSAPPVGIGTTPTGVIR